VWLKEYKMPRELFTLADDARRILETAFAKPIVQVGPSFGAVSKPFPAPENIGNFSPEPAPSA
jgi:hypothetical protein